MSWRSGVVLYPPVIVMQPSPMAETSRPLLPRVRRSMCFLLDLMDVDSRGVSSVTGAVDRGLVRCSARVPSPQRLAIVGGQGGPCAKESASEHSQRTAILGIGARRI